MLDDKVVRDCTHAYADSGNNGEYGRLADTVIHFGEPSGHPEIIGVHVAVVVHHEELAAALFIAVLMPLRQADVRDAQTGVHGVGVQPELAIA
jgi:hypothetical protein